MRSPATRSLSALMFACALLWSIPARAGLGLLVSRSKAAPVSEASTIVALREGRRTVLTYQPHYRGPREDFALVLPVPERVRARDIDVVDPGPIETLAQRSAPRLSEYWEQDPCNTSPRFEIQTSCFLNPRAFEHVPPRPPRIEPRRIAGEYTLTVLGGRDSLAAARWLEDRRYHLDPQAHAALHAYANAGARFVIAEVVGSELPFAGESGQLSPLRLVYDGPELELLPGLARLDGADAHDLNLHVLSRDGRYEVEARPNHVIPAALELRTVFHERLDEFYAALLEHRFDAAPTAAITQYAWRGESIPIETLIHFGLDRMPVPTRPEPQAGPPALDGDPQPHLGTNDMVDASEVWHPPGEEFTLTHLRMRFDAHAPAPRRLTLRRAGPIFNRDLASAPAPKVDQFAARYIIRHPWPGAVDCAQPSYGHWDTIPGHPSHDPDAPARPPVDTPSSAAGWLRPSARAALEDIVPGIEAAPVEARVGGHCQLAPAEHLDLSVLLLLGIPLYRRSRRATLRA